MSIKQCLICDHPERAAIERSRAEGHGRDGLVAAYPGINGNSVRKHFAPGHVASDGVRLTAVEDTHVVFNKSGDGKIALTGADGTPSDEEIRAIIAQAGHNPDEYEWEITSIRWSSAAWHRSEEVAAERKPHSAHTAPSCSVAIAVRRKTAPEDVVEVRQANPLEIKLTMSRPPKRDKGDLLTAVIVPDEQHPFSDRAALDVKNQLLAYIEKTEGVDRIVHNGDGQDLPAFSKHRSAPSQIATLQEGLEVGHQDLAKERAICPTALIDYIEGNHEARLVNYLVDHNIPLIGIRRAGDDSAEPVVSIPFLLRLDELGVTYHGPWPEAEVWLNDSFRIVHGTHTSGDVGQKYLADLECSTGAGHGHHVFVTYRTVHRGISGSRDYVSFSAGTLCRLDGMTPSAKSGVTAQGKPGKRHGEAWQQAIVIARYNPAGGEVPDVHAIRIINGRAVYDGRTFVAKCDADGNPLEVAA